MWRRLDIKGRKQQIKAELVGRRCGFLSSHDGGVWLFPFTFGWRWPGRVVMRGVASTPACGG